MNPAREVPCEAYLVEWNVWSKMLLKKNRDEKGIFGEKSSLNGQLFDFNAISSFTLDQKSNMIAR